MFNNFIYVFDKEASDLLFSKGYVFLKRDEKNGISIFLNKRQQSFSSPDIKFALSNTLFF